MRQAIDRSRQMERPYIHMMFQGISFAHDAQRATFFLRTETRFVTGRRRGARIKHRYWSLWHTDHLFTQVQYKVYSEKKSKFASLLRRKRCIRAVQKECFHWIVQSYATTSGNHSFAERNISLALKWLTTSHSIHKVAFITPTSWWVLSSHSPTSIEFYSLIQWAFIIIRQLSRITLGLEK